jgi:hypothetical protein
MTKNEAGKEIAAAYRLYMTQIDFVAEEIRRSVVIPTCNKHNWGFSAGMGRWCFVVDDETVHPDYNSKHPLINHLAEILDLEVPGYGYGIGTLMRDYWPHRGKGVSGG